VVLTLRRGVTLRGVLIGDPGPQYLVEVNSKSELKQFPASGSQFALEDRPRSRSMVCVLGEGEAKLGCGVALPGDGDEMSVTIPIGQPGTLRFTAYDVRGVRMDQPVLYVDRMTTRTSPVEGVVSLPVAPGQHVLVVNVAGGPERYESVVTVESGRVTELGRIDLR
jgi:hypothetical protein